MGSLPDLPKLDFRLWSGSAADKALLAQQWDEAFSTWGMAQIVGHELSSEAASALYESASDFFNQPIDEKMRWCLHKGYGSGGYVPSGVEAVGRSTGAQADAPPDIVENIVFSHGGDASEPVMPERPPSLRPAVQSYARGASALLNALMRLSAVALGLPETHFDDAFDPPKTHLRLAFYPETEAAADPANGKGGAMRYGAHTDYTGFTILRQDPKVSGLQVQAPTGEWVPVPPIEGALVINAGDLIQVWTNDRWRSPLHRVVAPTASADGGPSPARLSLVFFTGPKDDALISALPCCCGADNPPKYAPVSAKEHLLAKLGRSNV